MKKEKTKEKEKKNADEVSGLMPGRTVRTHSGKLVKQYPPKVGYHGTQEENRLNPEE